jgi:predicted phosphodiesterase
MARRIAAIFDIHSNLPALEAVLEDIRRAGVDGIVVGGDVLPGPMPVETIAALVALDIPTQFIHGNGDREVLASMRGGDSGAVPEQAREALRWVALQLGPEHEQVLASWPPTLNVEVDGLGEVMFCHATPRNDTDVFTRLTPEAPLLQVFDGVGARVVVCGHTHMQFDRMVGGIRVVNAGSVGMPFGEPGARWLLLGPDVEMRQTRYDLEQAAKRIRATGYPQAESFAATNVLQPPTEAEMLETFTRAGLK